MHRRQFLFGLGALALSPRSSEIAIDGARLNRRLRELEAFGRTPEGGISRVAFSEADRAARELATVWMREAGLAVRIDAAANLIGRREGRDRSLPPLLFGSHLDSVPDGGNYDGQVGSVGAIEVAQCLMEKGVDTVHPLEVVVFTNEENGKTGSRAMAGELEARELSLPSHTDKSVAEGVSFLGGDPDRIDEARLQPGEVFAFFELHVEQGAILDRRGIDVGVVEGIVGIERWNVRVDGFANHAGTTPMDERRDALTDRFPDRRCREPHRGRDGWTPRRDGREDCRTSGRTQRDSRPGGAHSRDPRPRHGEDRGARERYRGRSAPDRSS